MTVAVTAHPKIAWAAQATLLALGAGALCYAAVSHQSGSVDAALDPELARLDAVVAEKRFEAAQIGPAEARREKAEQQLATGCVDEMESSDPESERSNDVMRQLEDVAKKSGLDVRSIGPVSVVHGDVTDRRDLPMTVAGSFGGIQVFLDGVSRLRNIVVVARMDIQTPGANPTGTERIANLELQVHRLATNAPALRTVPDKSVKQLLGDEHG